MISRAAKKPRTPDEYLAALEPDQRRALERLRKIVHATAPGATEKIAYGLLVFVWHRMLVAIGATSGHCALYLMSAATLPAHADQVKGYDTGKGTIRFPAGKPLPAPLVRALVRTRMAEVEAKLPAKARAASPKQARKPRGR